MERRLPPRERLLLRLHLFICAACLRCKTQLTLLRQVVRQRAQRREAIQCPVCGGANKADAIFCANAACGKALGPFAYVHEELAAKSRWYERLAERATDFISRPHFLVVHSLWFLLWLVLNTGLFAIVGKFDIYPYNLLGLILSVESIFITGFLLISQNRQNAHADKRAE